MNKTKEMLFKAREVAKQELYNEKLQKLVKQEKQKIIEESKKKPLLHRLIPFTIQIKRR